MYFGSLGAFSGETPSFNKLSSLSLIHIFAASIKNIQDTRVGDTITTVKNAAAEPLPGYKKVNPMVYSGIYPADGAQYEDCLLYTSSIKADGNEVLRTPIHFNICLLYTSYLRH